MFVEVPVNGGQLFGEQSGREDKLVIVKILVFASETRIGHVPGGVAFVPVVKVAQPPVDVHESNGVNPLKHVPNVQLPPHAIHSA